MAFTFPLRPRFSWAMNKRSRRFSSFDGNVPRPSPRYAMTAQKLRDIGFDIRDDDFERIDAITNDGQSSLEALWCE